MTRETPEESGVDHAESGVNRRSLFRTGAGVGAVGVAAGVLGGSTFGTGIANAEAAHTEPRHTEAGHSAPHEPLVAHVHDVRTGEVDLFVGTRHYRVTDHQLAHHMAAAVERSSQSR